jgi:predicted lipid-binding transport protein (Tim44 family)
MMDSFNLVLLAIAAMVIWRFWGVLGTRTGTEKPSPKIPFPTPPQTGAPQPVEAEAATAVDIKDQAPVWKGFAAEGSELAGVLTAISEKSNAFTVPSFITGANTAYEMILEAFAKSDKATLKPLLARELYDSFNKVIDARKAEGQSQQFQFVGVKSSKIKSATLLGSKANIEVEFAADIISATLNAEGKIVDGDSTSIRTINDLWTFERDLSSRDPNWKLVATDDND